MNPVEKYDPIIRSAACSIAMRLRRLGWDADDCAQEARIALLDQPKLWAAVADLPTEDDRVRMVYTAARRAVLKASRRRPGREAQVEPTWLEQVEDRRGSLDVTVELADLICSGPHTIHSYLKLRLLDGMTWDETRDAMEVSNTRLAFIRMEAASWLLAQMEGSK